MQHVSLTGVELETCVCVRVSSLLLHIEYQKDCFRGYDLVLRLRSELGQGQG